MPLQITPDKAALESFCRANHIMWMAFFGSVTTERFNQNSDVDVLVTFDPDQVPGLFAMARMERELTDILGRKADLRTPEDLSDLFRDRVLNEAVVQYAA
jgi:predicted nucleotidyltransferase